MGGPDSTGRSVRDSGRRFAAGDGAGKDKIMKLKDIKIGKEYADSFNEKVTVLKVGVYGKVYYPGAFSTSRSDRADYISVKKRSGYIDEIHCRSIKHDWETQEKINKEKAKESSHGEAVVAYLWSILEQNTSLTRRSHWPSTRIELKHEEVVEVCKALEEHGQPKVKSPD